MIHTTKIYLVTNCFGDPNKVYIGKTKNPKRRKRDHSIKYGYNITYTEIDEVNSLKSKDWKPLECYWIEQFRVWGFKIMNKNKGGGGPDYHTDLFKLNLKLKTKGIPKPNGFGEKISKIKLENHIKFSKETCIKISKSKINHSMYKAQSFKDSHSKPIIQLDKENNIINTFKSINDAANSNLLFKRSNISCCLTGFSKSAYGFKWIYKNI
jgi:hypothetical protein